MRKGKTDDEIIKWYVERGIIVPEPFVKRMRDQYKKLKQSKLDINNLDQEAKEFKKVSLIEDPTEEVKALATGIFKEALDMILLKEEKRKKPGYINEVKRHSPEKMKKHQLLAEQEHKRLRKYYLLSEETRKFPMPPEIEYALAITLKMNPLIRFVKNLKAVNSIPPSYRIFLLNNKFFDIYYQDDGLMAKIDKKEYYLDDKIGDEGVNYAIKHINRLMTEPIMTSDEEEDDIDDMGDVPAPSGPKPPSPPPPPSPAATTGDDAMGDLET